MGGCDQVAGWSVTHLVARHHRSHAATRGNTTWRRPRGSDGFTQRCMHRCYEIRSLSTSFRGAWCSVIWWRWRMLRVYLDNCNWNGKWASKYMQYKTYTWSIWDGYWQYDIKITTTYSASHSSGDSPRDKDRTQPMITGWVVGCYR